jgi:uncharacterized protein (DUF4415 family)
MVCIWRWGSIFVKDQISCGRMTKSPRPVRQIGIRLSAEVLAWLEAIAKEQDHSVPHVIRRKLEAEFAREMKKTKPTKG